MTLAVKGSIPNTLTNIVSYQYFMHYRYQLVFLIGINITPLIYIAIGCIMRYVFSLRVFKQMDAHMHARIH